MPALDSESETVSVVIPCLNEADAISQVVHRAQQGIASVGLPGEVIVIDNGSSDRSAELATAAGARVVQEERRGYGNALRRGFAEARGCYIVMADGDDTYPLDELKPFIAPLRDGYGLVTGNRFQGELAPDSMVWSHRYVGTPLLTLLLRLFTGVQVADSQCGMRAVHRDVLRALDLRASGMELASEMLVRAAQCQVQVFEVPIRFSARTGASKLRTVPDGWRHMRYLLAVSPDYLYVVPGILLAIVSLLVLGLGAVAPAGIDIGSAHWQPRFAAIVTGALGTQVLWLGVLTKCFFSAAGLARNDRLARWYLRHVSLERALFGSALLLALGGVIEALVALEQIGATQLAWRVDPGLLGALLVIVGTQSLFGSFLTYAITSEYAWHREVGAPDISPSDDAVNDAHFELRS